MHRFSISRKVNMEKVDIAVEERSSIKSGVSAVQDCYARERVVRRVHCFGVHFQSKCCNISRSAIRERSTEAMRANMSIARLGS